jgi:hypothetical protein
MISIVIKKYFMLIYNKNKINMKKGTRPVFEKFEYFIKNFEIEGESIILKEDEEPLTGELMATKFQKLGLTLSPSEKEFVIKNGFIPIKSFIDIIKKYYNPESGGDFIKYLIGKNLFYATKDAQIPSTKINPETREITVTKGTFSGIRPDSNLVKIESSIKSVYFGINPKNPNVQGLYLFTEKEATFNKKAYEKIIEEYPRISDGLTKSTNELKEKEGGKITSNFIIIPRDDDSFQITGEGQMDHGRLDGLYVLGFDYYIEVPITGDSSDFYKVYSSREYIKDGKKGQTILGIIPKSFLNLNNLDIIKKESIPGAGIKVIE